MADERYQKLLGIHPADEVPTYYELLALDRSDVSEQTVEKAYKVQIRKLQEIRTSKDKGFLEYLKEELRKARRALADAERRRAYDESLLAGAVESFKDFVQPLMALGRISKSVAATMVDKGVSDGLSAERALQVVEEMAREHDAVLETDDEPEPAPEPAYVEPEPEPAYVEPEPAAAYAEPGPDAGYDDGEDPRFSTTSLDRAQLDAYGDAHGGYGAEEDVGADEASFTDDEPSFVDDAGDVPRGPAARGDGPPAPGRPRTNEFYGGGGAATGAVAPVARGPWQRDHAGRAGPPWGRGGTRTPWVAGGVRSRRPADGGRSARVGVRHGAADESGDGVDPAAASWGAGPPHKDQRWLSEAEQRQLQEAIRGFNLAAKLARIASDVHAKLRFYFPPANGRSARTYQINGVSYEKVFETEQKMYRDTLKKLEAAQARLGELQGGGADELRARLVENLKLVRGYLEDIRRHKMTQISGASQQEELRAWQEFVNGRRSNKLYQTVEEATSV